TGKEIRRIEVEPFRKTWAPVYDVAFLRGGRYLAVASRVHDEGSRIYVCEIATGKRAEHLNTALNDRPEGEKPRRLESWEVNRIPPSIVTSRDGRLLVRNGLPNSISIWDSLTAKRRCLLLGHEDSVTCVAFSPDSRMLASASGDNSIRIWDLETAKE